MFRNKCILVYKRFFLNNAVNVYFSILYYVSFVFIFKVVPIREDRYEVPITTYQDTPQTGIDDDDFLYDVDFVTEGKFGVQVKRKSSGNIMFLRFIFTIKTKITSYIASS